MAELQTLVDSIEAEVPYIRGELEKVFVEYTARILDERTVEQRPMRIRNGRVPGRQPSLEREGFELALWPSRVCREQMAELMAEKQLREMRQVQHDYWEDTIPLIRKLSGASEVLPVHAATVRFSPNAAGRKTWMTPAGWAHLDYDPDEAAVQLKETFELNGVKPRPCSRYVLYQGWRALTPPPQDIPLGICDGRTVEARDIVPIEYHMKTEDREVTYWSRGARYNPGHQWWYFPDMTLDEMIVFKGFDSANASSTNTLHTGFLDRTATDPNPRASVETRYFAIFD
jgi:hypothetical protein